MRFYDVVNNTKPGRGAAPPIEHHAPTQSGRWPDASMLEHIE